MDAMTDEAEVAGVEKTGRAIALSFLERRGYEGVREREDRDGLGIEAWEGTTLVLVALR